MKKSRKSVFFKALVISAVVAMLAPAGAQAASKKPVLSKSKLTLTLKSGKTVTHKLRVKNVTAKQLKKATWKTSNKKVATVSKNGKVTAKKAGKATISVKVAGKTLKCSVTVKKAAVKKSG